MCRDYPHARRGVGSRPVMTGPLRHRTMEMTGGSSACRTSLAPLASLGLHFCLIGVETEGLSGRTRCLGRDPFPLYGRTFVSSNKLTVSLVPDESSSTRNAHEPDRGKQSTVALRDAFLICHRWHTLPASLSTGLSGGENQCRPPSDVTLTNPCCTPLRCCDSDLPI